MINNKKSFLSGLELIGAIIVLFILSMIVFIYNKPLGAIAFVSSAYLAYTLNSYVKKKNQQYIDDIELLDEHFSDVTRCAVFSMPFPIAILTENGEINWYNTRFKTLFKERELLGEKIDKLVPKIDIKEIVSKEVGKKEVEVDGKNYQLYFNLADTYEQDNNNLVLIYAVDNSENALINKAYQDEALVIMVIQIDNFEELAGVTDENNRPIVFAEVDKEINTFAINYNGFARKYESDKYLCIFRKADFTKMMEDKFPIVEKVKEIEVYSSIPPTLSIGVGANPDNPLEIYKTARLSVDVALGRGGDQIVVNDGENLRFYGGKKKAIEKHNKVKSRVISLALNQLVEQSKGVYIMGHKNPDMDSFGSCLGVYAFIKQIGGSCRIVLKEVTAPIQSLYNQVALHMPEVLGDIITPEQALEEANTNSLIIVLDNHRKNSTEAPGLLDISDQVVLIDHHRRGANYIEDPTLTYLEPYASSTAELVTELIQYNEVDIEIPKIVADALLAGITVDTKSFSFQTGVRTFEAASVLKRYGADSISVKKLFREPADTVKYRSEVISEAEIYMDVVAISRFDNQMDNAVLIAAQAADGMLDMRGVEASFVLTHYEDKIHISGRSVGKLSVQLILEKIGGGGHQTSAGVQLKGVSINSAEAILKRAIKDYILEDNADESNTK
ncbi:DHH family phosphoesterase [Microaceticoccus formicicus]|uniref:DHH family phosphoesterase n=1 Tax=Microaceticoccus formicicus TaxID=3118105 RepID=UPI003CD01FFA|nr:DHH family phosphoesterase [Peptoniphilaceae bacterium AMB_02]